MCVCVCLRVCDPYNHSHVGKQHTTTCCFGPSCLHTHTQCLMSICNHMLHTCTYMSTHIHVRPHVHVHVYIIIHILYSSNNVGIPLSIKVYTTIECCTYTHQKTTVHLGWNQYLTFANTNECTRQFEYSSAIRH